MAVGAKSVNLALQLETQDGRDVRSESLLGPKTLTQGRVEGRTVVSWGKAEFSGFRCPNPRNCRESRQEQASGAEGR